MGKSNGEKTKRNRKRAKEIMEILSRHDLIHGITPEKLVDIFVDLGPTFVKLGQLLSMRTDLLPVAYCTQLAALRTNISPLSFQEIQEILEAEYGKALQEVFQNFDPVPIGAASIAQVHRATLADQGVVVKVQRPGIYETMSSDILLMKKAVGLIDAANLTGEEIDLGKILDEMWTVTKKEIDFRYEAENLRRFRKNCGEFKYATCPLVYEEVSTHRVLVMGYAGGVYIDDLDSLKENGYDTKEIAEKLANHYVKQVIEDGFFHADPHAGNIKIDGGKIMWLDLGMVGELTAWEKKLLGEIVKGFDDNNINRIADAVLRLGTPLGDIDMAALNRDLESFVAKYALGDIGTMDTKALIEDFFSLIRRNRMAFPEDLSILGRGISSLEGVLLVLDSEISFVKVIGNYVTNNFMKTLHPDQALKEFVKSGYDSAKKLFALPAQLSDALKLLEKGLTKVKLEVALSQKMKTDLDAMINKLVMSTLAAALLIGSSLICTTDMKPKLFNIPAIGFIGFASAVILMIKLLFFDKGKKK